MPTTVRQRLVNAIESRFQGITVAGGYNTGLGSNVFVWRAGEFQEQELPALNLMDVEDVHESKPSGIEEHALTLTVELADKPGGDKGANTRMMIADIYQAIGVDRKFTEAATSTPLAYQTELVKDEMGQEQGEKIVATARVTFRVKYRTALLDPYTLR